MATKTKGVIEKKVGERLTLGFRYHSPTLDDGETITGLSVTAQAGITAGTGQISGREVYVPISGGTAGTDYTIRFTITTDQGQTIIDDYVVKVKA